MSKRFRHYKQAHSRECGAVCLKMIAQYYGRIYSTDQLRSLANQQREGVTLLDISNAAESIGMHTVGAKISYARLIDDIPLPGVVHYKGNHFVVVLEANSKNVTLSDPDLDRTVTITVNDFLSKWTGGGSIQDEGVILLMEPTADFFSNEEQQRSKRTLKHFWETVLANKGLLWVLGISMFIGAFLTVTVPFLLQMTVDESIEHQNGKLLTVILLAWLCLFICRVGMDFVKRFTMFHIGSRVNIQLVTDFMIKVMQLPVQFFETKRTDDIMQTLYDNPKIQRFFTRDMVTVVLAFVLFLAFSLILLAFNWQIFLFFLGFTVLQSLFIWLFLQKRYPLNYRRHELSASHYSKLNDLIRGIKEIKLNNAEKTRRWVWESSEAQMHRIGKDYTKSNELYLQIPYYIGELRDIIIIYMAAVAVINGSMSIGVLVAIIFILLQLNNPLKQIIDFWLGWSETKMSLERMNEIHNQETGPKEIKVEILPEKASILGENVSFRFEGGQSPWVLQHLNFNIPYGKVTAIIGPSGSGKTTLLNLLLNFLKVDEGIIRIADLKLSEMSNTRWLSACGVVQQDGHLFTDTIAKNIALGEEILDSKRLVEAARIANVLPFLERFQDGFSTIIGDGGKGLSKGQRQSILIARAVYNIPDYLFLDEATNDLDSQSERLVFKRILEAFKGKTVVIIANRMNLPVKVDNVIPVSMPKTSQAPANLLKENKGGNAEGSFNMNGDWTFENPVLLSEI